MDDFVTVIESVSSSIIQVHGRRGYPLSSVVWAKDIIVTTNRAVERDEDIKVKLADGSVHDATLVGRDPRTDLAVLRVTNTLHVANWKTTEGLKVGQWLLRVARPNGLRATHGILGHVGSAWNTAMGGRIEEAIYTDATAFTGFSGGAVVTTNAEVIGINSAALNQSGNAVITTSTIKRVVEAVLEHGYVKRGYLGISMQPVKLPEGMGQRKGLMIIAVEKDSPAHQAGLALGDTLLYFDGRSIDNPNDLVAGLTVGQVAAIKILRGGEVKDMSVTVGEK
jgi:S1-C subfamily serine protease